MELQKRILARIRAGKVTEDTELDPALNTLGIDSLTWLDLTLEMEELKELGFEPSVTIKTVGDLLWLLKAIEFWHERNRKTRL